MPKPKTFFSADQLALPLYDAPAPAFHVFFAILLDARTAAQAHALAVNLDAQHGWRAALRPQRLLHLTLEGLIRDDPQTVEAAKRAASRLMLPRFEIWFDRVRDFALDHQHALALGVDRDSDSAMALRDLRELLRQELKREGLPIGSASFTPHVTLLYAPAQLIEGEVESVRVAVKEFHLVRSLHGWSRLVRLGAWRLQ